MSRFALILPTLLIAACSTTAPPVPPAPAPESAATPAQPPAPPRPAKAETVATTESPREAFDRLLYSFDRDSIFFDYNKSAIKPSADSVIARHATVLQSYPRDNLTLQGNCDERGSSEYNLALGQRRADAVKERLVLLGVAANRIETVSFGKEKPRATCHEETCWAENRRADFVDAWK